MKKSSWAEDQMDPDNWLRIPEFNIIPRDVDFGGFTFPIVTPLTQDEPFATSLRELVRTARQLARSEFRTLNELRAHALEGSRLIWPAERDQRQNRAQKLTRRHKHAVRYMLAMEYFEAADRQWHLGRRAEERITDVHRLAAGSIAIGANMVIGWLTDRPFEQDLKAIDRMRQGASIGGKASGLSRLQSSNVPAQAVLLGERDKLTSSGRDPRTIASLLATRYGCTAGHIRRRMNSSRS